MVHSNPISALLFRTAIIGCGWIGVGYSKNTNDIKADTHLKAYQDCPQTKLVALSDLYGCTDRFSAGLPVYTDYMEMVLEEDIDIVSVCTPPETHRKIVCDLAPFVRAIYCEKPIALTLQDADAMIDYCHKCGTLLQINHQRRFINPKIRFSRGIMDTGSHLFDLLRKMFGDPIRIITPNLLQLPDKSFCEIEEVETNDHIFEFDWTRSKESMIGKGVSHLVASLLTGCESESSGEDGREALRLALVYKELSEKV